MVKQYARLTPHVKLRTLAESLRGGCLALPPSLHLFGQVAVVRPPNNCHECMTFALVGISFPNVARGMDRECLQLS